MNIKKIVETISLINLVTIILIFVDVFFLPNINIQEVYDYKSFESSHDRRGRSYEMFIIVSKRGNRYNISENPAINIQDNSEFVFLKTRVLQIPEGIIYTNGNALSKTILNPFKTNFLFQIIILVVTAVTIYNFKKDRNINAKYNLLLFSFIYYAALFIVVFQM